MVEYCFLYAFIIFLTIYFYTKPIDKRETIKTKINALCFFSVFVILAFRHESMGIDLLGYNDAPGYLYYFDVYKRASMALLLSELTKFEIGFRLYIKFLTTIWNNHQFFIAITAFLSLAPIGYYFEKKSNNPAHSWLIYISLMPFYLLYSGLRQGIAIGLGALLFLIAEAKRPFLFIIVCSFAVSFHMSAILLFLIYPIMNLSINKKWRIAGTATFVLFYIFRDEIKKATIFLFPQYEYVFLVDGEGAYRYFMMLLSIYIICCIFAEENWFQNAYLNMFFIACAFQLLGLYSEQAPRASFYFVIALPVLLPVICEGIENRLISRVMIIGTIIGFTAVGFYCIYSTEWAMAYPYYWFWETVI